MFSTNNLFAGRPEIAVVFFVEGASAEEVKVTIRIRGGIGVFW